MKSALLSLLLAALPLSAAHAQASVCLHTHEQSRQENAGAQPSPPHKQCGLSDGNQQDKYVFIGDLAPEAPARPEQFDDLVKASAAWQYGHTDYQPTFADTTQRERHAAAEIPAVPEPSELVLLLLGLVLIGVRSRVQRR